MKLIKSSVLCIILMNIFTVNAVERVCSNKINLDKMTDIAVKEYAFPGAVLAAGSSNTDYVVQAFGFNTYAKQIKNTPDSIFDLASMSKVCATTPSIMKLYDEGKIKLSDKVVKYIPEFTSNNKLQKRLKSKVTIENLLSHTSGLPPDNDVYKMINASLKEKWAHLYKTPLAYFPSQKYAYSDVNMLMLQKIVEKISGMPLDQFVRNNIYKPLGMNYTFYNPPKKFDNRIVPTEFSIYTNKPYKGTVDDENARGLGGIAGHAGLYSTVKDISIYAKMLLNKGEYKGTRIFKPSTVNKFTKRANVIPGSSRALGWDTVYNPHYVIPNQDRNDKDFILDKSDLYEILNQCSAGLYIDPDAFGHTGYTGTSIWISPKYDVYVILLSNRVFPFRDYTPYNVFAYWRQAINSAVWKNLGFTKKNQLNQQVIPHYYHKAN